MINTNVNGRYRDNQELLYLLRSIEKYFLFYNKIYLLVDHQIPEWLNTENPDIIIINHSDIIPKKYLPLFSSRAIESFIHHIEDISNTFIYLNDDIFFHRKVEWSDLIDANNYNFINMPVFHYENKPVPSDDLSEKNLLFPPK
jgi:hypothetical protein